MSYQPDYADLAEVENETVGAVLLRPRVSSGEETEKDPAAVNESASFTTAKRIPASRSGEQTVRSSSGSVRFSGSETGSTFKQTPAAVETPRPKPKNDAQSSFDRLVYMPPKVVEFLNRKGMSDPLAVLSRSYSKSVREQTFEQRGITITFPVEWERGGEGMVAILKKNEKSYGRQWYLTYVGFPKLEQEMEAEQEKDTADENTSLSPTKALESFADVGFWQEFLKELSDLARPERWEASNKKLGRYYTLKKYIQYTFYRLQQEDQIFISEDGELAVFNTGLMGRY